MKRNGDGAGGGKAKQEQLDLDWNGVCRVVRDISTRVPVRRRPAPLTNGLTFTLTFFF